MTVDAGLVAWVEEAMAPVGRITSRAMMGGRALYCDGIVLAILGGDDGLWLKADAETDAEWDAAGCERFSYTFPDGRTGTMNYRRAPDDCYDDADALRRWGELALAAGVRAAAAKRPRAPRRRATRTTPR